MEQTISGYYMRMQELAPTGGHFYTGRIGMNFLPPRVLRKAGPLCLVNSILQTIEDHENVQHLVRLFKILEVVIDARLGNNHYLHSILPVASWYVVVMLLRNLFP